VCSEHETRQDGFAGRYQLHHLQCNFHANRIF
jgi:hypothetical protein